MRADAAQYRSGGAEHEADQQGGQRAEPRDHQRAGDGGSGKQHHRQAGQDADLGFRQMQVVVDERDDRRHRQDGQAERNAREPEQQQRADIELAHRKPLVRAEAGRSKLSRSVHLARFTLPWRGRADAERMK